jgi:N-alpha-acetyltransferase 40
MGFHATIASNLPPIEKVMLTYFVSNERALTFYTKMGFKKDGISPTPRKLRFGKEYVPDYAILSQRVQREAQ